MFCSPTTFGHPCVGFPCWAAFCSAHPVVPPRCLGGTALLHVAHRCAVGSTTRKTELCASALARLFACMPLCRLVPARPATGQRIIILCACSCTVAFAQLRLRGRLAAMAADDWQSCRSGCNVQLLHCCAAASRLLGRSCRSTVAPICFCTQVLAVVRSP